MAWFGGLGANREMEASAATQISGVSADLPMLTIARPTLVKRPVNLHYDAPTNSSDRLFYYTGFCLWDYSLTAIVRAG